MNVAIYLASRGATATAADLGRAGFSRHRIAAAVDQGAMVRIRRGQYGLPQDAGVYRAALELKGLLTCLSAAPSYGLWTLLPAQSMHLYLGHRAAPPGAVAHGRCRHPRHPWLPVAGLADVLIHALHCLPELEALVMVQCAVGRGDISLAFLRGKLEGNRNGGGGTTRATSAATLCSGSVTTTSSIIRSGWLPRCWRCWISGEAAPSGRSASSLYIPGAHCASAGGPGASSGVSGSKCPRTAGLLPKRETGLRRRLSPRPRR